MDCFGLNRAQSLQVFELIMDSIAESRRKNVEGQLDLFGSSMQASGVTAVQIKIPDVPDLSRREKLAMERETTGLFISGHPMEEYRQAAQQVGAVRITSIMSDFAQEGGSVKFSDGQRVVIAGIITSVRRKTTKSNSMMAYVVIEDDGVSMEMLVFARTLNESGNYLREDMAVYCGGRISVRDEKEPQLMADYIRPLADLDDRLPMQEPEKTLYIKIPSVESPVYRRSKLVLSMFPGDTRTVLYIADTKKRLGGHCLIDDALLNELRELLGEENVVVK